MDDQPSGGSGEAARDRDQLPSDGRGGGFGVEDRRDGPGSAGEVERDRGQNKPRVVGPKLAGRQMGEGAALQVGDRLLDYGVGLA